MLDEYVKPEIALPLAAVGFFYAMRSFFMLIEYFTTGKSPVDKSGGSGGKSRFESDVDNKLAHQEILMLLRALGAAQESMRQQLVDSERRHQEALNRIAIACESMSEVSRSLLAKEDREAEEIREIRGAVVNGMNENATQVKTLRNQLVLQGALDAKHQSSDGNDD